jgi:chromosome segregation ATPase
VDELRAFNGRLTGDNLELDTRLKDATAAEAKVRAECGALQARYEELEVKCGELRARQGELQARCDELRARIDELQAGLWQWQQRHRQLEEKLATLRHRLAERLWRVYQSIPLLGRFINKLRSVKRWWAGV